LTHPQRPGHLAALHPLFLQIQDVFIASHSLGLTGLLRLLDGWCLSRAPFFCTTQLGKRPGELRRDTGGAFRPSRRDQSRVALVGQAVPIGAPGA